MPFARRIDAGADGAVQVASAGERRPDARRRCAEGSCPRRCAPHRGEATHRDELRALSGGGASCGWRRSCGRVRTPLRLRGEIGGAATDVGAARFDQLSECACCLSVRVRVESHVESCWCERPRCRNERSQCLLVVACLLRGALSGRVRWVDGSGVVANALST
eukprot:3260275-Pleurochrysis_carterae.AAC.1